MSFSIIFISLYLVNNIKYRDMKFLLRIFSVIVALFVTFGASAQGNDPSVKWKGEIKELGENTYELLLEGTVREG